LKEISEQKDNWLKVKSGFIFATIILMIAGICLFIYYYNANLDIEDNNLVIIEDLVISVKPEQKEVTGQNHREWIDFNCKNYQKRFSINNFDYKCANKREIFSDINVGDTITIKMIKSEFLDIYDETFTSKTNKIHSLIFKDKEYIDLECRNYEDKVDKLIAAYICSMLSILTLIVSFLKEKPKIFGFPFNPTYIIAAIGLILIVVFKRYFF